MLRSPRRPQRKERARFSGTGNELAHARAIVVRLMAELEVITEQPELFHRVRVIFDLTGDEPTTGRRVEMRGARSMIASLPVYAKIMKNLVDALHKLVGAGREAWGG